MADEILVIAEKDSANKLKKVTLEAVSEAKALADKLKLAVSVLSIGEYAEVVAAELEPFAIDKLYTATALIPAVKKISPRVILFAATSQGKDLSARLGASLSLSVACDCIDIEVDPSGKLLFIRPIYAGKILSKIALNQDAQIATLRPHIFPIKIAGTAKKPEIVSIAAEAEPAPRYRIKEFVPQAAGKIELTEAEVIVSGGRGMKGAENFKILEELASVLHAAVGASRSAVDAGWRPHSDQVGQTGKVVSPKLYIACGISGSIQHLVGMSSSKSILAVNKDPNAPIFKKADYGIVGDLFEVVPLLTSEFKKLLG